MSIDALLTRIRGEFREMPGLRLTRTQARRFFQLDQADCDRLLENLVREGFLRSVNGTYTTTGNTRDAHRVAERRHPSKRVPLADNS